MSEKFQLSDMNKIHNLVARAGEFTEESEIESDPLMVVNLIKNMREMLRVYVEPGKEDIERLKRISKAHLKRASENGVLLEKARKERAILAAALGKVVALHQPLVNEISALYPKPLCTCGREYPCPSAEAVEIPMFDREYCESCFTCALWHSQQEPRIVINDWDIRCHTCREKDCTRRDDHENSCSTEELRLREREERKR